MRKINTRSFVRATRHTTRDINRQILLNLVREHQPVSRADLARQMGIGRGMITSLVGELIDDGFLYEGSTINAPRGRKPMMLYVRTQDRLAIAIDVRFSKTYLMLSDLAGNSIALESFDTVVEPDALVRLLAQRIKRMLNANHAEKKCNGIGLVIPGMVDQETGRVLNAPQLGWRDVDVSMALAAATGYEVHIENAPIACAVAQMWLGERGAETPRDFIYLTVSDGVGTGIVMNGEVVRGHAFTAGEFGHISVEPNGPSCLCGARGCLEAYTSNLATLSRYMGREFSRGEARRLLSESGLTITDVVARAKDGDADAQAALAVTARYLGRGLAVIVNALNPAQIFVGGEINDVWEQLEPIMREGIAERALTETAARTPLLADPASSHPRLRGAVALVAAPVFAAPRVA